METQRLFNEHRLERAFDLNAKTRENVKLDVDGQCVPNTKKEEEEGKQERNVRRDRCFSVRQVLRRPRNELGLHNGTEAPEEVGKSSRHPTPKIGLDQDGGEAAVSTSCGGGGGGRPTCRKGLAERIGLGVAWDFPNVTKKEWICWSAVMPVVE